LLDDVRLFEALEGDECYAYGTLVAGRVGEAEKVKRLLAKRMPGAAVSRLDPIIDLPGAATSLPAPYHYVVETDVLPEFETDFNLWYEREHLPGLAAVPGTARACRFRSVEGSPRYHACYDTVSPSTVGSPPWIVVRGTAWSQRVRPAFRNTKRTMFLRRQ
jgi:hypothetical protein